MVKLVLLQKPGAELKKGIRSCRAIGLMWYVCNTWISAALVQDMGWKGTKLSRLLKASSISRDASEKRASKRPRFGST